MKHIILPKTDLDVSQLGFGTASLHHLISKKDREVLLKVVLDQGLTHFDTAPLYGEGLAERTLGNFLGLTRNEITIGTKIGIPLNPVLEAFPLLMYAQKSIKAWTRTLRNLHSIRQRSLQKNQIEKSLQRSLRTLRTDWIDILFVHEPQIEEIPQLLEICDWLQSQKVQGNVRYLGLAGQSLSCVEISKKIPGIFDVLQVEDSLSNHEADLLTTSGLPLQITFGYLRNSLELTKEISHPEVIQAAFRRNSNGMILVSSRNPNRIQALSTFI